jgi:hypothetical protein
MSFWKNLFSPLGSAGDQLSDSGVRALIEYLPRVQTEILQFFEPGTSIMMGQEVFIPNVLAEFRDPSMALVYGEGAGHAFVKVQAVQGVAYHLRSSGLTWYELVHALESKGYRVKHIHYFVCETSRV